MSDKKPNLNFFLNIKQGKTPPGCLYLVKVTGRTAADVVIRDELFKEKARGKNKH